MTPAEIPLKFEDRKATDTVETVIVETSAAIISITRVVSASEVPQSTEFELGDAAIPGPVHEPAIAALAPDVPAPPASIIDAMDNLKLPPGISAQPELDVAP